MTVVGRDFYIPRGAIKVAHKNSDAVVYLFTSAAGAPCAMGFHGKAIKPDFRFRYHKEELREAAVVRYFASREARIAATTKRRAEAKRPNKLQVGHILKASWGYEQTNIDFYQVTRIVGARMVEVREISQTKTEETGWLQGRSVPLLDEFIGEPMRRRVSQGDAVRIDDVRRASLWNGKPASWSAYH